MVAAAKGNNRLEYKQVTGWDENNFWVIAGELFGSGGRSLRGGHWKTPENCPRLPLRSRLLDQERLLVASGTAADSVFEVSPRGKVACGKEGDQEGRSQPGGVRSQAFWLQVDLHDQFRPLLSDLRGS